jgi:hypothetical protein
MVMLVRALQPRNASFPILVTLLGMVRLAKGVFSKALIPILVTLDGIVTLVIEELLNQFAPIVVNPLASIMLVGQYLNALLSMLVTPVPIVTVARFEQ